MVPGGLRYDRFVVVRALRSSPFPVPLVKTVSGISKSVLGYLVGYWVIILVLMPLYYRLNLISIYTYLEQRFDTWSYKTGAILFFLFQESLGRLLLRLYLCSNSSAGVLFDVLAHSFFRNRGHNNCAYLDLLYVPGRCKNMIVYTDSFQTLFLVTAVCVAVWQISSQLNLSFVGTLSTFSVTASIRRCLLR